MKIFKNITIYVMALLYLYVGFKHFIDTEFFVAIVPPFIKWKKEVVFLSGLIEIILGILLFFRKTRKFSALAIIVLLILVFPANIYLYISDTTREMLSISKKQALIRIPFQIPLIIISYWHSLEIYSKKLSIISIALFIPTIVYFVSI